jgi:hypothetical protein
MRVFVQSRGCNNACLPIITSVGDGAVCVQTTASTVPATASGVSGQQQTSEQPAEDASVLHGGTKPVFLLSTRHIVRVWASYGALLPVLKGTADAPLTVLHAVQSLFEEFMLWIVTVFAGVSPEGVMRGLGGTHDRFYQVGALHHHNCRKCNGASSAIHNQPFGAGFAADVQLAFAPLC